MSDHNRLSRKGFLRASAMATVGILAASCAQPTPQVIEKPVTVEKVVQQTVVVEKPVTVEKVVQQTVVVEKQVTVEKVVTATAVPAKFGEAPMLADMVKAGTLPPVEERLGQEPMVMEVVDQIGKYGGTIRRAFIAPSDVGCNVGRMNGVMATRWTNDGINVIPYIAKAWEPQNNGQSWVFHLRQGMKWSDGEPFTADDWVFMVNDVLENKDLRPTPPPWVRGPGGPLATIEKLDDYTVKFTYGQPFYPLPQMMAAEGCLSTSVPWEPAHYFKQFHKTYAGDKADQLAKAANFETWTQYYANQENYALNIERPSVRAWLFQNTSADTTIHVTRNPYYPVVDPEGNQLPYIDEVRYDLVENTDVVVLKGIEGSIDFQARHLQLTSVPVLSENQDKGGYNLVLVPGFGGNDCMFNVNTTYDGPEGVLLANRDFRVGLSLAVDRGFIQETDFLGMGMQSNYLPAPNSPQHPGPEWETKNATYDPDQANQLLDGIIAKKDNEGFRTLPDGSRLELLISCTPAFGPWPDVAEQVAKMWSDVGVRSRVEVLERSLLENRRLANQLQFYVWGPGRSVNVFVQSDWVDPAVSTPWSQQSENWYSSNGAQGIEPPDEIKHLHDLVVQGRGLPPEQANPLAQEIYKYIIDNQVIIGTVRRSPMVQGVTVVSKKLANIPEAWANDTTFNTPWPAFPEQFYYKA